MKELKFKPDLLVPFDDKGNQMGHDYGVSSWETNKVFKVEIKFIKFSQGRSSVKARFKDIKTGREYEMFFSDFEYLVQSEILSYGYYLDYFHFEKRGANWGLVPHLRREYDE